MRDIDQLVNDIRKLFRSGATPMGLIRYIERTYPDEHLRRLIQEIFSEAFDVGPIRIPSGKSVSEYSNKTCDILCRSLVYKMVQRHSDWGQKPEEEVFWEGLSISDEHFDNNHINLTEIPELEDDLDRLSLKAKKYIQRIIATSDYVFENLQILTRLCERLQRKLDGVE